MNYEKCPYCNEGIEINHDDDIGYSENKIYTQECYICGKTFSYTTSIVIDHDLQKCPCQNEENGKYGEHKFFDAIRHSDGTITEQCEYCGEIRKIKESKNADN